MEKKGKKKEKNWGRYFLLFSLFLILVVNGAWAMEELSGLEKARRKMIKNPNDIEARLEWWEGLVETEYWKEVLKEEDYFGKMYEAVSKEQKEKIEAIKKVIRQEYPGYIEEDLEKMDEREKEGNKDWWIRKAKMEMKLGNYKEALESIKKAREIDGVDEEIEKIERELG